MKMQAYTCAGAHHVTCASVGMHCTGGAGVKEGSLLQRKTSKGYFSVLGLFTVALGRSHLVLGSAVMLSLRKRRGF